MRLLRLIAVVLAALSVVAATLAAGCGGNEFVLAESDAASRDTGAQPDAASGADGPVGAFCDALHSYYVRCQYTAPCDQRNLDNCTVYGNMLSDAARGAFVTCQQMIACAHGAAWVHESCVRGKLVAATPTPEQARLANDYCTTCGQATAGCSAVTFYNEGLIQATDGQGFDSLLYDDMLVHGVDQACINTLSCVGFRTCEDLYLASQVPSDACPRDGG